MTGTRTHRPPDVKRRQYQVLDSSSNKTQAESGLKECPQGTDYKVTLKVIFKSVKVTESKDKGISRLWF